MKDRDKERLDKERRIVTNVLKAFGWATVILLILLVFYAWHKGLFSSMEKMETFISRFGLLSPIVFILFHIIQIVIIPIIPGGAGTIAGIALFGVVKGTILNYIGICLGSFLAFFLAKRYGRRFVLKFVDAKKYDKYEERLSKGHSFEIFFALCIVLPFAPDDLLCYLAGLTELSYKKFALIILIGKIPVLVAYCAGIGVLFH